MTRWLPLLLVVVSLHAEEVHVGRGLKGEPAVAAGVDEFLVAWTDGARLQARRVPVDAEPRVIGETADARIAAAFDGVDYLIVWGDTTGVRARFLSSTEVFTLLVERSPVAPPVAVAWNGVDFVVAWGSTTSVFAALIRPDGGIVQSTVLDSGLQLPRHVSVSTGIDRELILYAGERDSNAILDAQIVGRDLDWLTTTRVDTLPTAPGCMGSRALVAPQAIWLGGDWMLTWVQSSCFLGQSNLVARMSRYGTLSSQRVVLPVSPGVVKSQLLPIHNEPALLTQFLKHGQANDPVFLRFVTRDDRPRKVLEPVAALAATVVGRNELVLVYRRGDGVVARTEPVALPPLTRRRACCQNRR